MVSQIVERIRKKDQRAMNQLYQMYVGELTSVCYRYIPNADDAKDVLQNSFVKIFTSIPTLEYRGDEQFKGWLVRIVANEALMFLRNKKKLLFVEQNETADEMDENNVDPDTERITPNYSHRQIAELLGIKESTSASQLYYAKQWLARRIKELTSEKGCTRIGQNK